MEIRKATPDDMETLVALRRLQLADEGQAPGPALDEPLRYFFRRGFEEGFLEQWLAEEAGQALATGAFAVHLFPPSFSHLGTARGYVCNMCTLPQHRGRGLATALLGQIKQGAQARGISRLWLGASPMGRPVYEKFGFVPRPTVMELQF